MQDHIIMGVLAVVVAIGLVYTVRHFQHKSACCGGGRYRVKKKKLTRIIYQKTFTVEGMHCKHCQSRVEEIVNDIKGVAGTVDLKKSELIVSYAETVEDERIIARIEAAGYTVTSVQ